MLYVIEEKTPDKRVENQIYCNYCGLQTTHNRIFFGKNRYYCSFRCLLKASGFNNVVLGVSFMFSSFLIMIFEFSLNLNIFVFRIFSPMFFFLGAFILAIGVFGSIFCIINT